MRKKVISILTMFALSFSIFATGQQGESDPVPAFDPEKEYSLSFGGYGDLERAYKTIFESAEFKKALPNITFEYQMADFGGHHDRLTTVLAAGEATNDIEALEIGFIAKFVEGGGLTNLAAAPFNGIEEGKDIVPFAMSNATTAEGRLVAYPVDIAPAVLFYRKSLADAAGVSLDNLKSWDEYIEAGKKLTIDKDGDGVIDQFAMPHASEVAMMPLNGGKGGWFDEDNNPLQPKQKFMDSLDLVKKIREAGIDGDLGAWSGPWIQAFADGTVASIVNGAWWGGALKAWVASDLAGDWRVAPLPGGLYASQGGTYLSIPQQVPLENKAAAWEVIKYLTTTSHAQLSTFEQIDAYPALTTVYDDDIMNEDVPYFGGQKIRQLYADVANNIPSAKVSEYDAVVLAIFNNAVTDVLVNGSSSEDAYNKALNEIRAIVD